MDKKELYRTLLILLVLLLAGAGLRLYHLDSEDIWLDEAVSLNYNADGTFPEMMHALADRDSNPPLYFLLLHYWRHIGKDAFTLRLLSVIFGILSIPVFYLLAKNLFSNTHAILSTIFWTFSIYHLYYSQELRMYSLQILLILLSSYFFLRLLKSQNSGILDWVLYIFFSLAGLYTQYFTLFVLIAQGLAVVLIWSKEKSNKLILLKKWLLSQIIILILCIPLHPLFHAQHFRGNTAWIPKTKILDVILTPIHLLLGGNIAIPRIAEIIAGLVFLLILVILFRKKNIISQWRENYSRELIFLLTWLILPILLFLLISIFRPVYLVDRYLIISLPAFYLLLAFLIDQLFVSKQKWIVTGILFLSIGISLYSYFHQTKKPPFHIPVQIIQTNLQPGDILIFLPAGQYPGFQHYFRGAAPGYPDTRIPGYFYPKQFLQMWENQTQHPSRIWYLSVDNNSPEITQFLDSHYKEKQSLWQFKSEITSQAQLTLYQNLSHQ